MNTINSNQNEVDFETSSVPVTRYDLQVLRSLRRIIRAIDIYSHKLKTTCQLTVPQLICLQSIVEDEPLNARTISERVYLSPSTIAGILDRLEIRGLVIRERDRRDRRIVNVSATEKGIRLAEEAPSPLQDNLANALNRLPELEQATIALSLKRIVDLMEVQQFDAAPILETNNLENSDLNGNGKEMES